MVRKTQAMESNTLSRQFQPWTCKLINLSGRHLTWCMQGNDHLLFEAFVKIISDNLHRVSIFLMNGKRITSTT